MTIQKVKVRDQRNKKGDLFIVFIYLYFIYTLLYLFIQTNVI